MKLNPAELSGSIKNSEEPETIEDTIVFFAIVARGPLRDFYEAAAKIRNLPETRLIYQRKSLGYLWIKNGQPQGGEDDDHK